MAAHGIGGFDERVIDSYNLDGAVLDTIVVQSSSD